MRGPPMTSGYSWPTTDFTCASAFSIAARFCGLVKSVSGLSRTSLSLRFCACGSVITSVGICFLRRLCCSGSGMYSKSSRHATCALALLFAAACSSILPWHDEPTGNEVNVTFVILNNLLFLNSVSVDGRPGRFLLGSAQARTIIDPKFTTERGPHSLQLNQRESVRFVPVVADLHAVADAIVGGDVWGNHAITIDYRAGIVTFQREGMHPELMIVYKYADDPTAT